MNEFSKFNFIAPLMKTINEIGYTTPTPIQEQAIPHLMLGKDLLGIAQTGTGKTAAFSLPIINNLVDCGKRAAGGGKTRVLVITPTRELATQIHTSFKKYGKDFRLYTTVIFGGVSQYPQIKSVSKSVDVLVATPGRLLDLVSQGFINLSTVEVFVLDEADRLLDMGFANDINRIVKLLPKNRQNLLFSATMPENISKLADKILTNPIKVEATPQATTVDKISQKVYFVEKYNKSKLLKSILKEEAVTRTLVFTRTKHGADKLVKQLSTDNIVSIAIHGNKSQSARENALSQFKKGEVTVLIATDIASRGLDIPNISHVVNFDIPTEPENYVHRIGRTARAGKEGVALSFCDSLEYKLLKSIEKTIGLKVAVETQHFFS